MAIIMSLNRILFFFCCADDVRSVLSRYVCANYQTERTNGHTFGIIVISNKQIK